VPRIAANSAKKADVVRGSAASDGGFYIGGRQQSADPPDMKSWNEAAGAGLPHDDAADRSRTKSLLPTPDNDGAIPNQNGTR
jgi:hypothetical protein